MSRLADIAKATTHKVRTKLSIDDLISRYPEGVTICGAYIFNHNDQDLKCFLFEENSDQFFYAHSGEIAKLFNEWLDACKGDCITLNKELAEEPLKVKIYRVPRKRGGCFTKAVMAD